jgi:hypothetical protein
MKMEQIECSETSAYKIQTPGNYPEENIQHIYLYSLLNWGLDRMFKFKLWLLNHRK